MEMKEKWMEMKEKWMKIKEKLEEMDGNES